MAAAGCWSARAEAKKGRPREGPPPCLTPRGRAVAGPLIEAAREHERAVLEPFGASNASTLVTVLQRLIARNR